jgi:phospholipid-translocating ATPase
MTKGADSIVLPRIKTTAEEASINALALKSLHSFALEGLRTLVVGQRILNRREYEKFAREYDELKISTAKDKDEQLNKLYDMYEKELHYVGATAIEDKL